MKWIEQWLLWSLSPLALDQFILIHLGHIHLILILTWGTHSNGLSPFLTQIIVYMVITLLVAFPCTMVLSESMCSNFLSLHSSVIFWLAYFWILSKFILVYGCVPLSKTLNHLFWLYVSLAIGFLRPSSRFSHFWLRCLWLMILMTCLFYMLILGGSVWLSRLLLMHILIAKSIICDNPWWLRLVEVFRVSYVVRANSHKYLRSSICGMCIMNWIFLSTLGLRYL